MEWLGQVPEHWETKRLKSSMINIVEHTTERLESDRYVALEHVESWTGRLAHADPDISFDSQVKRFRSGDVLFGKLRPYLAKVARPTSNGVCVGEFLVLRPRDSKATAPYTELLLRSQPIIDAVNRSTFGAKMPRADWQFIGGMLVAYPTLAEQVAIVRFLDHADRRIRRYIRSKERLIELLEEQKQATIHQAVTGQIDVRTGQPYPTYKDSGVEWLGNVPQHWEIAALRHVATKFGSGITPRGGATVYRATGIPFLRSQNVHFDGLRLEGVARIPRDLHLALKGTHVKPGDVLLNITGASIGRVCAVPRDLEEANVNQHVCIIRPKPERLLSDFLAAFLSTPVVQNEIGLEQVGASREGLTLDSIRSFKLTIPTVNEQQQIMVGVQTACEQLTALASANKRQIDVLYEYRTRLIADVVTGQFDVREAVASLADVETLDESLERNPEAIPKEPDPALP